MKYFLIACAALATSQAFALAAFPPLSCTGSFYDGPHQGKAVAAQVKVVSSTEGTESTRNADFLADLSVAIQGEAARSVRGRLHAFRVSSLKGDQTLFVLSAEGL